MFKNKRDFFFLSPDLHQLDINTMHGILIYSWQTDKYVDTDMLEEIFYGKDNDHFLREFHYYLLANELFIRSYSE